MRRLLYDGAMGPFDATVFGIFIYTPNVDSTLSGLLTTRWYQGPSFPGAVEDEITSAVFDALKIVPGRIVEFKVYEVENGIELESRSILPLASSCAAITTAAAVVRETETPGTPDSLTGLVELIYSSCANVECGSHSPCLPPNNALRCVGGVKQCYQAERPVAEHDCGGQ